MGVQLTDLPPGMRDQAERQLTPKLAEIRDRAANEAREKALNKDEKEIQRQIGDFLRLLRVEFINPPMHKHSFLPEGWPDFTFCYKGHPLAMECKTWNERPRPEQNARMAKLSENGWQVHVVRSLMDVQDILRDIDTNPAGAPAPADQGEGR